MMFKGIKKIFKSRPNRKGVYFTDKPSYDAIHYRVTQLLTKPNLCKCGKKTPVDLHNIDGKYSQDLSDWEWLCRSCHSKLHRPIGYRKNNKTYLDTRKLFIKLKNGIKKR